MAYGVRGEERTFFGREVLTVWSGPFFSVYEGEAVALPRGDGYMLRMLHGHDEPVRVECPVPRTDENYQEIDAAIVAAVEKWYTDKGYVSLTVPTA